MFQGPFVGKDGDYTIALIVLAVCPVHEDVVQAWAMDRAVSEGIWCPISDLSDAQQLLRANLRVDSDAISNVDGPLLVA